MISRREDNVLKLVGAIHSSIGAPDGWKASFDGFSDIMNASGMLIGKTPHAAGHFDLVGHRIDPEIVGRINGPLATRAANPVFCAVPRSPVLTPMLISDLMDDDMLLGSSVYNEALKPAGIRHVIAVVLACDQNHALTISFGRDKSRGNFDKSDATTLAAIAPHMLAALRTENELAMARHNGSLLDSFDRGVILLDDTGVLCFANREAERILAQDDGLAVVQGRVATKRSDECTRLRLMLRQAGAAAQGKGIEVGGVMTVSRPSLRPSYAVVVTPAKGETEMLVDIGPRARVAMFIRDPARRSLPPADWLSQLYQLTPTEARIALDIHQGLSLAESAAVHSISMNTIKTHLKTIFEKVDVSRQSALVREIGLAMGDLSLADAEFGGARLTQNLSDGADYSVG